MSTGLDGARAHLAALEARAPQLDLQPVDPQMRDESELVARRYTERRAAVEHELTAARERVTDLEARES